MDKTQKQQFVSSMKNTLVNSDAVLVTHYHGLNVDVLTELRRDLRKSGATYVVVKNRLMKIATDETKFADINDMFTGPTAIVVASDPISAAKSLVTFAKNNDNLKIVGGYVGNELVDQKGVVTLSKLPSLDELKGKIVGLLSAPARNIASIIQTPARDVVGVVSAYSKKGE